MRAPALQALGSRRGRLAVPLVLAGVVAAGWAGTLLLGAATEGHAEHHGGLAALLFAAGLAQLSPHRQACLSRCREASFTADGTGGLFGGFRASLSSIACCGLLMLVPFATGVMSLSWMAALTVLLVVEREIPHATRLSTIAGVLLLVLGAWKLA